MRLRFGVYRHEAVGKKFAELLCGWRKECNNSMADNTGVRINKFLSEAGVCSRREADRMVEQGRITIDDKPVTAGTRVHDGAVVRVDGRQVTKEQEENGEPIKNVVDYIDYPKRVYPVGRLDQASEGLLLLTNQGDVMEKILRNRYGHEKEYFVKVDRPIRDEDLRKLAAGVPILDTVTKPCKVWREDADSFHIILTQGLNRQIRRMCEYLDYRVTHLRRDRVMNITLKGLKKGRYRSLTPMEIRVLRKELER